MRVARPSSHPLLLGQVGDPGTHILQGAVPSGVPAGIAWQQNGLTCMPKPTN